MVVINYTLQPHGACEQMVEERIKERTRHGTSVLMWDRSVLMIRRWLQVWETAAHYHLVHSVVLLGKSCTISCQVVWISKELTLSGEWVSAVATSGGSVLSKRAARYVR